MRLEISLCRLLLHVVIFIGVVDGGEGWPLTLENWRGRIHLAPQFFSQDSEISFIFTIEVTIVIFPLVDFWGFSWRIRKF